MIDKYTWTNEMYQAMVDRAEAAESRAAQSEEQRDTAWKELREIRRLIEADKDESTFDEVTRKLYRLSKDAHDAEQETKKLHERTRQAEAERDKARKTCERMNEIIKNIAKERGDAREERDEARRKLQTTQHVLRYWLREGRFLVPNCDEYNNAIDMLRSVVEVEP